MTIFDERYIFPFLFASAVGIPMSGLGYVACDEIAKTYPRVRRAQVPFAVIGVAQIGVICMIPFVRTAMVYYYVNRN